MLLPNQTFPADVGAAPHNHHLHPEGREERRGFIKGEMEHRLTTLAGSPQEIPRGSCQRQTAKVSLERNDLRAHTYEKKEGKREGEEGGDEKKEE